MLKFRSLLIVILQLSLVCITNAQDSLIYRYTFEEALAISFKQNHLIKQTQQLKQQKVQEYKASKGIQYPKIELSANFIKMSDDLHLDLSPVKDAITPLYQGLSTYGIFSGVPNPAGGQLPDNMSTSVVRGKFAEGLANIESGEWDKMIQEKQFASVNLMASMPLFTGGKIRASIQAASIGVKDADYALAEKQNQLITELVERYYGLCLASQAEIVRKQVMKAMEEHLSDAEKMKREGIIANAEFLHAKVYFSEAERELKKAQRQITITNRALISSLGGNEQSNISPFSQLFYIEEIEPVEYFQRMALENNPQLKHVESKQTLAQIGTKVELSNYMPSISLIGTYDLWNQNLSPYTPEWIVGLGLKWTIFDGLAREHKVSSAQAKVAQVSEFQQKIVSDIKTAIEKYYQELQMSLEQLRDLNTATEFTEEYYRIRQKAFREGMATSTDVIDAELALTKVKIEKLQAAYKFDISLSKLLEISGLSEKFIEYQKSPKAKIESYIK